MKQPEPVLVLDLLPDERARLLSLLSGLSDDDWDTPTACVRWSVKDVGLHILGVDIAILSRRRDGHRIDPRKFDRWRELVSYLNEWNEAWVRAARRISPRLLIGLLQFTGEETVRYFSSLDFYATGEPVSWAGPGPAPIWLDVAREYTERWLHQQHIREALGRLGLTGRRFLAPVLATFAWALPHTFRNVAAPAGTHVKLVVSGESGGEWSVVRRRGRWVLGTDAAEDASSVVHLDQDTAWRLLTKGLSPEEATTRARLEGDRSLGLRVLDAVAIIA